MLDKYRPGTSLFKSRRFDLSNKLAYLRSDAINVLLSIVESSDQKTKDVIAKEI